ncbi:MAG: hypothetical protein ACI4XA_10940 [Oscillospiraceae bacterium]
MMGGSFVNLVKREFYISKKGLIAGALIFVAAVTVFLLILLSTYHGNVKTVFDSIVNSMGNTASKSEEFQEQVRETWESMVNIVVYVVKYIPLFYLGCLADTVANTAINDDKKLWTYFRRSTPVPAWKYSLANVVLYAVVAVLNFAVGTAYLAVISAITGTALLAQDIAVLLSFLAVGLLFGLVFQTLIKLLHSVDKAGIALVIVLFGTIIPYNIIHTIVDPEGTKQAAEGFEFQGLLDFLTNTLLPFLPFIIVGILALMFVANYLLLIRREK